MSNPLIKTIKSSPWKWLEPLEYHVQLDSDINSLYGGKGETTASA